MIYIDIDRTTEREMRDRERERGGERVRKNKRKKIMRYIYPDIREVEEVIPDEDRSVVDQPRRHRHVVNGGGPTFNYQHRPRHDDHRGTRGRRPNRGMYNHVYYPY